jgi:hypothetical protein
MRRPGELAENMQLPEPPSPALRWIWHETT